MSTKKMFAHQRAQIVRVQYPPDDEEVQVLTMLDAWHRLNQRTNQKKAFQDLIDPRELGIRCGNDSVRIISVLAGLVRRHLVFRNRSGYRLSRYGREWLQNLQTVIK